MKHSSSPTRSCRKPTKGFTIIELTIIVIIVGIIVAIAVTALGNSKSDSTQKGAEGTAKTVNDAILRARLAGDEDPRIVGEGADDIQAAVDYLKSRGYID